MAQTKIYKADFYFENPGTDQDWDFSLFIRTEIPAKELREMFRDPMPGTFCSHFGKHGPHDATDNFPRVYGVAHYWDEPDFMIYGVHLTKLKQSNEEEAGDDFIFDLTPESWEAADKFACDNYMQ